MSSRTILSPWSVRADREDEREQKRAVILAMAARLFSTRGYRNTSLDDVARELSVTKPTLYYYFRNKDELLYQCARRALDQLTAAHQSITSGPGTGLDKLVAFLHEYAAVIETDFGRCFVRIGDHELAHESRARIRRVLSAIDRKMRGLVEDAVADGSIKPCDARTTAFALAGLLNSIGHWHRPDDSLSVRQIAERYINLAVQGLG